MSMTLNDLGMEVKILLDAIHNPVMTIDRQGCVAVCNRAMEKILDKPLPEMQGKPLTSIVDNSKLADILETGTTEIASKIDLDGKTYMANRSVVTSSDGIVGAISVLQDVSELHSVIAELEQTQRFSAELEAIIESSYDGIYVTDGEARTLRVNSAYERITGINRDEVLGRTMFDLVEAGFFSNSVTLKVLETAKPTSIIQTVKTGKTVMVTGNPFFDAQGKMDLVVTNVRDVTELHHAQQRLETLEKQHSETAAELRQLRGEFCRKNQVVLRSKKMQELRTTALRLANVESTVLIQGESGCGKEVFADLIHWGGPRWERPLIKVNCGAFPENLLESELFGYTAGAFTGAQKNGKAGLFEVAHGGTLFLDEFGEMPPALQVKLLRVLQTREVQRLGSTSPIKVDVRILAATNRDLEKMVAEKLLREDLFFRINVVRLVIPPLRERREDILPLAYMFLEKFNRQYRLSKQLERSLLNRLLSYSWPGNVRELENLIEQLVVITEGEIIRERNLPKGWGGEKRSYSLDEVGERSLNDIMADVESRLLRTVMQTYKTTREAAKILKVDQSTVVRKLHRYGIISA